MMEVIHTTETSVCFNSTRLHGAISQKTVQHTRRHENLKSHLLYCVNVYKLNKNINTNVYKYRRSWCTISFWHQFEKVSLYTAAFQKVFSFSGMLQKYGSSAIKGHQPLSHGLSHWWKLYQSTRCFMSQETRNLAQICSYYDFPQNRLHISTFGFHGNRGRIMRFNSCLM
jgi:hypothetical protein